MNHFGWRAGLPPRELWKVPLQFHVNGGPVFVVAIGDDARLALQMACGALWWRMTGIAKQLAGGEVA